MMMLHKRITPLLQSVTDCVMKKHAHSTSCFNPRSKYSHLLHLNINWWPCGC